MRLDIKASKCCRIKAPERSRWTFVNPGFTSSNKVPIFCTETVRTLTLTSKGPLPWLPKQVTKMEDLDQSGFSRATPAQVPSAHVAMETLHLDYKSCDVIRC